MAYKYHINPNTGVPGRCRAKEGNCPYGGREEHFDTYSQAQTYVQNNLETKHGLLPVTEEIEDIEEDINNSEYNQRRYYRMLEGLSKKELHEKLRNTEDSELVMGVINQELYANIDSKSMIAAALENPNISREFVNDIIESPRGYSLETQRHLMNNKSLSHRDLITMVKNTNDIYTQTLAHRNPGLSKKYVSHMMENHSDKMKQLPFLGIMYNHAVNEGLDDWYIKVEIEEGIKDRSRLNSIIKEYPYWHWTG